MEAGVLDGLLQWVMGGPALASVVKSDYKRWALYQNVTVALLNSYYVFFIYIICYF